MFKRNDYALLAARILLIISFIFLMIYIPVLCIYIAVKVHWAYIFLMFPLWVIVCVIWIYGRLVLSFFCDVKLIRNKLYGEENKKLEVFLKSHKQFLNKNGKEDIKNNDEVVEEQSDAPNRETGVEISDNTGGNKSDVKLSKWIILSIVLAVVLVLITIVLVVYFTTV